MLSAAVTNCSEMHCGIPSCEVYEIKWAEQVHVWEIWRMLGCIHT